MVSTQISELDVKQNQMDFISNNPGLKQIIEEIFMKLDYESLLLCRHVCLSWEEILKKPIFWLKKCHQLGMPFDIQDEWKTFLEKYEFYSFIMNGSRNQNLEAKIVFVLKNMTQKKDFVFPKDFFFFFETPTWLFS